MCLTMRQKDNRPRVLIIGGGFAGLAAARALKHTPVTVTLLDRKNHHLFQPLLYQVATAALSAPDIAAPLRRILRDQNNATVLLAEVQQILPEQKKVLCDAGEYSYDYLVVASGAQSTYFGHDEWRAIAPSLKSLEDALAIRRRVLRTYEMAERTEDLALRAELLSFIVVGGGPTGVELAGALAEIARYTMVRDFRHISSTDVCVHLVESGPRILASFAEHLSIKAKRHLQKLGVHVHENCSIQAVDANGATTPAGRIAARTIVWAAGIAGSALGAFLKAPRDKAGRVFVEPDLRLSNYPQIFVVGDLAAIRDGSKFVPGLAPAAKQAGEHAASNIARLVRGEPTTPFQYVDRGAMATIGRSSGIAAIGRYSISGFWGWVLWLFVHIYFLIGFRNRLVIMFEWAWAYFTFQRSARIILDEVDRD